MKKLMTALLWIGLAVCLTMLFVVIGQKNALARKESNAVRKNESLQALYDDAKEKIKEAAEDKKTLANANAALTAEKEALEQKLSETNAALMALRTEAEALAAAQMEWEAQRQSLTAEKEATDSRLNEALAVLLPGVTEEAWGREASLFSQPASEDEGDGPADSAEAPSEAEELLPVQPELQ